MVKLSKLVKPKARTKGNGKGNGKAQRVPGALMGMNPRTKKGEAICFAFNLPGGCSEAVSENKCKKGHHVCMKPGCGKADHGADKHP